MNGAIPAQAAMASAIASLSSPPAMGVKWSNGVCAGGRTNTCRQYEEEKGLPKHIATVDESPNWQVRILDSRVLMSTFAVIRVQVSQFTGTL